MSHKLQCETVLGVYEILQVLQPGALNGRFSFVAALSYMRMVMTARRELAVGIGRKGVHKITGVLCLYARMAEPRENWQIWCFLHKCC